MLIVTRFIVIVWAFALFGDSAVLASNFENESSLERADSTGEEVAYKSACFCAFENKKHVDAVRKDPPDYTVLLESCHDGLSGEECRVTCDPPYREIGQLLYNGTKSCLDCWDGRRGAPRYYVFKQCLLD